LEKKLRVSNFSTLLLYDFPTVDTLSSCFEEILSKAKGLTDINSTICKTQDHTIVQTGCPNIGGSTKVPKPMLWYEYFLVWILSLMFKQVNEVIPSSGVAPDARDMQTEREPIQWAAT
jgi:hypothetical protein